MSFIKNNNFHLFTGFPEIINIVKWNSDNKNWKDFISIANNENIKTIIYDEGTLEQVFTRLDEKLNQPRKINNGHFIT